MLAVNSKLCSYICHRTSSSWAACVWHSDSMCGVHTTARGCPVSAFRLNVRCSHNSTRVSSICIQTQSAVFTQQHEGVQSLKLMEGRQQVWHSEQRAGGEVVEDVLKPLQASGDLRRHPQTPGHLLVALHSRKHRIQPLCQTVHQQLW